MRRSRVLASVGAGALSAFLAAAACVGSDPDASAVGADASPDGVSLSETGTDGGTDGATNDVDPGDGACTSDMPFKDYVPLPMPINTPSHEFLARLDPEERHLYLSRAAGTDIILRFDHDAATDTWTSGINLLPDSRDNYAGPWTSADRKHLYYSRRSVAAATSDHLHLSMVDLIGDAGTTLLNPRNLGGIGDGTVDNIDPYLAPDESELWFSSAVGGGPKPYEIMHAKALGDGGFKDLEKLSAPVNTTANERIPVISADGLTLYYATDSGRAPGSFVIKMARRPSTTEAFGAPVEPVGIGPLQQAPLTSSPAWISPDNCRLYVGTTVNGLYDIYVARRR